MVIQSPKTKTKHICFEMIPEHGRISYLESDSKRRLFNLHGSVFSSYWSLFMKNKFSNIPSFTIFLTKVGFYFFLSQVPFFVKKWRKKELKSKQVNSLICLTMNMNRGFLYCTVAFNKKKKRLALTYSTKEGMPSHSQQSF